MPKTSITPKLLGRTRRSSARAVSRFELRRWVCQVLDGRLRFEILYRRIRNNRHAAQVVMPFLNKYFQHGRVNLGRFA